MILIAGGKENSGFREPTKDELKGIAKWLSLSEKERNRIINKAERERKLTR